MFFLEGPFGLDFDLDPGPPSDWMDGSSDRFENIHTAPLLSHVIPNSRPRRTGLLGVRHLCDVITAHLVEVIGILTGMLIPSVCPCVHCPFLSFYGSDLLRKNITSVSIR